MLIKWSIFLYSIGPLCECYCVKYSAQRKILVKCNRRIECKNVKNVKYLWNTLQQFWTVNSGGRRQLPIHWLPPTHIEWYSCQKFKSSPHQTKTIQKSIYWSRTRSSMSKQQKNAYLGHCTKYQLQLFLPQDRSYFCVRQIPFLRRLDLIFASDGSYFWAGSSLLAFPTAALVYATPPQKPLLCRQRWDAFKTVWEPVSRSGSPDFFAAGW